MCDHELVAARAKHVRTTCDAAASSLESINQRIAQLTSEAAAHGLAAGDGRGTAEGKAVETGFATHNAEQDPGVPAPTHGLRAGSSAKELLPPAKLLPEALKRELSEVVAKCSVSHAWDTRRLIAIGYAKHQHRRVHRRYRRPGVVCTRARALCVTRPPCDFVAMHRAARIRRDIEFFATLTHELGRFYVRCSASVGVVPAPKCHSSPP